MGFVDDRIAEFGPVSSERANEFASQAITAFMHTGEGNTPAQKAWSINSLPEAGPLEWQSINLYDIDGRLLFRDKTLALTNGNELRIRVAASPLLGVPVWSASSGPRWDIQAAIAKAQDVATRNGLIFATDGTAITCYSYPRLGLLCTRGADHERFVIDLGDRSILGTSVAARATSPEGPTIWSPFDFVTPATLGRLKANWVASLQRLAPLRADLQNVRDGVKAPAPAAAEVTLDLTLIPQQSEVFCAVAVGDMIMQFFGFPETQDAIAAAMHTGPNGTTSQDQVTGYSTLSGGRLQAQFFDPPSWELAQQEFGASRPLKSGVPGHARVGAGCKTNDLGSFLYIYDPYPEDSGRIYWEAWGVPSIVHTNFICVRRTGEA